MPTRQLIPDNPSAAEVLIAIDALQAAASQQNNTATARHQAFKAHLWRDLELQLNQARLTAATLATVR